MHFTRMGGYRDQRRADHRPRRRVLPRGRERQALPRRARRPVLRQHRLLVRRGDRPGGARADARAALLHQLVVRASARDRARRRGRVARAGRPQPRLLRLGRLGGGRVGLEARAPVLRRAGREARCRQPSAASPSARHDAIVAAPRARAATRRSRASIAYHGTTLGALSINGIPALRTPFEPLVPEVRHVRNTNRYHRPPEETEEEFTPFLLDDLEQTIVAMGPETVCLVHMEPVQNAGGCVHAARRATGRACASSATEYDILLSADEVITGFGRLGYWFGSERYDIRPDIITSAKGLSSSYAAIGAVIAHRPGDGAVPRVDVDVHARDHLRRAPRDVRDRAQEHRDHEARGDRRARARERGACSARSSRRCSTFRSSATSAAPASSTRSSSSRTRRRVQTFDDDECETLLRGYLSPALFDAGLICRADDRGDPVIQISPPLVAGEGEMDEIVRHPRRGAGEAGRRVSGVSARSAETPEIELHGSYGARTSQSCGNGPALNGPALEEDVRLRRPSGC